MTIPFLRPRLTGARFEEHAIPLEVLKDIAVFEEMIIEIAKAAFLADHPERRRSPRGFTEGVEMKLVGVEDGSAVPVIGLAIASATLFPTEAQLYFERARDSVIRAITAAEFDHGITEHVPARLLGYFDRIGRSLLDGEAIEFDTPEGNVARLNKVTRRRLLQASSSIRELTEAVTIRGHIAEVDQADMSFEIQLADGRKIKAPLAVQHLETILEAFRGYQSKRRVALQGIGRFNFANRLLSFDSVEHVSLLDPLDVPARLEEIALLKDGWLDGKGVAPAKRGLDWLAQTFAAQYPDDLPLPYAYPTPDGGARLEWTLKATDISLDINLTNYVGAWHALDMETEEESSRELRLDEPSGWRWLIDELRRVAGGPV